MRVKGLSQDFPGAVQKGHIRRVKRKDSPRGTTGSRPPSGVPRATLRSHAGEQWLTGYFRIRSVFFFDTEKNVYESYVMGVKLIQMHLIF
ncbi:hypothetical protein NPIL_65401 [Nephila pilipes]|uniref:Uncharacterized protein n=1 Tax=Nephila pilipes TaxID=299642 RepID=A0A8X6TTS2_NEPPI|nr:hypothetical protein NPIL_65401 [Nephila pilipes]